MAGLDVTHQFHGDPGAHRPGSRAIDGRLAHVIADLFAFFTANYLRRHDAGDARGAAVHDPLAVLALTHPDLFDGADRHVAIETTGRTPRGMTVIDRRDISDRATRRTCSVLERRRRRRGLGDRSSPDRRTPVADCCDG